MAIHLIKQAQRAASSIPFAPADHSGDPTCNGTVGNDLLIGTGNNASIFGYGGDDSITGGPHTACLHGGEGNDSLTATAAKANVYGDAGDDSISAPPAVSNLYGPDGTDELAVHVFLRLTPGAELPAADFMILQRKSAPVSGRALGYGGR
jgi:Ca2+-binding RTX toxin-like protein